MITPQQRETIEVVLEQLAANAHGFRAGGIDCAAHENEKLHAALSALLAAYDQIQQETDTHVQWRQKTLELWIAQAQCEIRIWGGRGLAAGRCAKEQNALADHLDAEWKRASLRAKAEP